MAAYASGSDDDVSRGGGSPIPRGLFSDDDGSDRGGISEAEEDNSLNRREGYGGGGASASGRAKNSDEEEEEEERRRAEKKKKEEEKKKKPKGPVRRQMISEDMLTGRNGISTLPDLFKDFTFGGKGQERQDLNKILSKLEHWIHLLHPKQPFDQCLERIEYLGGKRKVIKTHLKKIRMGMVNNYDENDIVDEEGDEEIMENIDTTELAESASAFGNGQEGELDNLGDDEHVPVTLSVQVPTATLTSGPSNDNEFPDDDDDIFGGIDESTIANSKAADEMDVDMDDIPQFNEDDEDDDFFSKQIEMQIKRAQEADTQQQSQVKGPEPIVAKDAIANHSTLADNDETLLVYSRTQGTPLKVPVNGNNSDISLQPPNETRLEPSENNEGKSVTKETVTEANKDNVETVDSAVENKVGRDDDGINLDDLEDNEEDDEMVIDA